MTPLNADVREYTVQLRNGHIQRAYRGIIGFMSSLKADLECKYTDHNTGAVYFGYMDMTYFAFTPSKLTDKRLKIAIVYLHEEGKFELWLVGNNRKVQAETISLLRHKNLGRYALSRVQPGVDSIIASVIVEQPNFDEPNELKKIIETKTMEFETDVSSMLN